MEAANRRCTPSRVPANQLHFRHFFDCVPRPFPADAALLHASVRHLIDARCRNVVQDDPTESQGFGGLEGATKVAGADADLQPVIAGVHLRDRILDFPVPVKRNNRAENLFRTYVQSRIGITENRWLQGSLATDSTGQNAAAGTPRLADP